jgi:MFS superfamily sulfate permease-like transporter
VDAAGSGIDWFLLNAEAIVELDVTAADALRQLAKDFEKRHVVFAMARVKQELRKQIVRGGLLDIIDEERFYPTLPVAVEAYQGWREHR